MRIASPHPYKLIIQNKGEIASPHFATHLRGCFAGIAMTVFQGREGLIGALTQNSIHFENCRQHRSSSFASTQYSYWAEKL
jgi:hypothetical protein